MKDYKKLVKLFCKAFLIGCIVLNSNNLYAQTDTLWGVYDNLHLTKEKYVIASEVIVKDSFIVDAGVHLFFKRNAIINSLGSIELNGKPTNRILFVSLNENEPAMGGIAVSNPTSAASVSIQYSDFKGLLLPISFKTDWERKKVDINNCQFINNKGNLYVIEVNNPNLFSLAMKNYIIDFALTQNLFANNNSSIYIQDLNLESLKYTVKNNVFYGNFVKGLDIVSFSNNFISVRADVKALSNDNLITRNVFLYNTLRQISTDTIIRNANIGIYGSTTFLEMSNNYWENNNAQVADTFLIPLQMGIIDRNSDINSPKIIFQPRSKEDPNDLPPHIYMIKNDRMEIIGNDFDYKGNLRSLMLVPNRTVNIEQLKVHFTGYLDSVFVKDSVLKIKSANQENGMIGVQISDDFTSKVIVGYLYIDGIKGMENEFVPPVTIGYKDYLVEKYKIDVYGGITQMLYSKKDTAAAIYHQANNKSVVQQYDELVKYRKKYEIGITTGASVFYGSVSNRNIFKNDKNIGIGIKARYIFNPFLSASLSISKLTLSNSDSKSNDSINISRGVRFRDPISALSLMLEYSFMNNEYFNVHRKMLRPFFGFGIDYIHFNPQGYYLGKWYNLQPLKTGGQKSPYKLTTLGLPIVLGLRYNIDKNYGLSVQAEYHYTFSDYLDDVGPDTYPAKSSFTGTNAAIAYYFSNPTNKATTNKELRDNGVGKDAFFYFSIGFHYRF